MLIALTVLVPAAPAAAATDPGAARVIEIAKAQAGDPYIAGSTGPRGGKHEGLAEAAARSAVRSIGSSVGREIIRGVLGSILGGGRRR